LVSARVAQVLAAVAGVSPDAVTIDTGHQRVIASMAALPGASLGTYRELERRASAALDGWEVVLVPPVQPLPSIEFAIGESDLTSTATAALERAIWAARRWNITTIAVSGLRDPLPDKPPLAAQRAMRVSASLRNSGFDVRTAPVTGESVQLTAVPPDSQ
jgi:hypothetical protein